MNRDSDSDRDAPNEPPTILVVDDNPITRKLVRATLQAEGYVVVEAQDGRTAIEQMAAHAPHLVLQDLILPDLDGFELAQRLHATSPRANVPILAFSGFHAQAQADEILEHGFAEYLCKPVEPSLLARVVRAYLPEAHRAPAKADEAWRIVVAHDDPVQLKLLRLHLEQAGFQVITAEDGVEALDQVRRQRPTAVVSDVLMPGLDGFRLCQAIREDEEIGHIPLILVSAAYTEEEDRRLAATVGASALVTLTPDMGDVVEALLASLAEPGHQPPHLPVPDVVEQYTERVVRQLERQAGVSADLAGRLSMLEAELGILAELAQTLVKTPVIDAVLADLLHRCVDAAGVSRGAAYLVQPDGRLALCAQHGYGPSDQEALRDLFGHAEQLQQVLTTGEPMALPSARASSDQVDDLLLQAKAKSMLVTPLILGGERLGLIVMASEDGYLGEDWLAFVKVVGSQIGQAIGLARALAQLRENEERLTFLAEASTILGGTLDAEVTLTNLAHCAVPFLADWCIVDAAVDGQPIRRLAAAHADPTRIPWLHELRVDQAVDPNAPHGIARVLRTGQSELYAEVTDAELAAHVTDPQLLDILRRLGVRSAMIVPIVARGQTLAVMSLVRTDRHYGPADLLLAEDLARRAALAVDNARLYQEAQEAVRMREEFLAIAAHELKTPVTSLRGFAQWTVQQIDRQAALDPVRVRQALHVIDQQSSKLSSLMSQLLDVSRIKAGNLALDRRVADVAGLVESVVAAARLRTSQHALVLQAPPAAPALVDPFRLEQVVTNLVDNAIKYSPNGGQIDVEVSTPDPETVRLAVRDRGIGIPPEHRERIFDRFYQVQRKRHSGGMGLGLYISRHIVHLHGGELLAEFPPDGGTRFVVTLPTQAGCIGAEGAAAV